MIQKKTTTNQKKKIAPVIRRVQNPRVVVVHHLPQTTIPGKRKDRKGKRNHQNRVIAAQQLVPAQV